MRVKKPLEATISKYVDFLNEVKDYSYPHKSVFVTIQFRIKNNHINKSVLPAMIKMEIIKLVNDNEWNWMAGEPDRKMALEVLNFCLELNKKQITTPISGFESEIIAYVKEIRDNLIHNTTKQTDSVHGLKSGLLSKALNQAEVSQTNHLFTQIETEQSKKFELLKAVTSGWYAQYDHITPFQNVNDKIILATDDLYNKFFKK